MKIATLLFGLMLLVGCGQETPTNPHAEVGISGPVSSGDTALVHYTGTLADGTIFESTESEQARPVTVGSEQILPALEQSLIGMHAGDSKTITIPADQAFGPHLNEPGMIVRVERASLAHSLDLEVGMRINAAVFADENATESKVLPVTVTALDEKFVTIDANHPLAGKDLTFEVSLVKIESRATDTSSSTYDY